MKKVAGSLKLAYSQYRELQSFAQFGSDLDADTKARLANGERIVEVLKQGRTSPISVEHQVMIIYAVTNNLLEKIPVEKVSDFQNEMFEFMDTRYPQIGEEIINTKDLSKENTKALHEALQEFVKYFLKNN